MQTRRQKEAAARRAKYKGLAVTGAAAVVAFVAGLVVATPDNPPRLVGYGCAGAQGPVYAAEEDHLPRCAAIVPIR